MENWNHRIRYAVNGMPMTANLSLPTCAITDKLTACIISRLCCQHAVKDDLIRIFAIDITQPSCEEP